MESTTQDAEQPAKAQMPADTPVTNQLLGEDVHELRHSSLGYCYIILAPQLHNMRAVMRDFERKAAKYDQSQEEKKNVGA